MPYAGVLLKGRRFSGIEKGPSICSWTKASTRLLLTSSRLTWHPSSGLWLIPMSPSLVSLRISFSTARTFTSYTPHLLRENDGRVCTRPCIMQLSL
jgi:hypothetical protein